MEDERLHLEDRAAWRAWLAEHHDRSAGVWLVSWRKGAGRPAVTYEEAIEEALCFGWVDSRAGRLDDERTMLRFSPRRPRGAWSRSNKERVERLEAAGLMTGAGRRAVEAAKADGGWQVLDSVEELVVPDDLAAAFALRPGSGERFEAFPRSVRRSILGWIAQAKRPTTRAARVEEAARLAERGERANQWRPPGDGLCGEPPRR
ncbi:MAG: YdeI/OmpD-associated family protein [Candidatus Limnocylindrales bacterium]